MELGNLIQLAAISALPLLFAITLSEAARGRAAYWLGDKTGWSQGRLSWNPANHITPMETVVIPMVMFLATGGGVVFGGAKPIPIDYRNLREPKKNSAIWIEMASPIALLLMALLWYVALIVLKLLQIDEAFFRGTCSAGVMVCLSLFAFQLLPIPPLSGGRILLFSLPQKYAMQLAKIEPWSMWIILLLAFAGIIGPLWIAPVRSLGLGFLQLLTSPLTALLS